MKTRNQLRGVKFVAVVMALCAFAMSAYSAVLIDELFESGYNRTVNNIAGGNLAWSKGRSGTIATVNVGSLSFSASANGGADGEWGYFTDPGANFLITGTSSAVVDGHVILGVGDVLKASVSLYLGTMPSNTSDASLRFGLFDTATGRSITDFNGGPSSTMFTNNLGFATFYSLMSTPTNNGMSILTHTVLTSANIFSSSSNFSAIDGAGGGDMLGMFSMTNYTLSFSVGRPDASTWVLTSEVRDTLTGALIEGMMVSTNEGLTSFNWLMLRWNRMPDAVGQRTYTEIKVEVVPEPSTLMLAGCGLALAAFAIRRRR
jgi:hypothetical protein